MADTANLRLLDAYLQSIAGLAAGAHAYTRLHNPRTHAITRIVIIAPNDVVHWQCQCGEYGACPRPIALAVLITHLYQGLVMYIHQCLSCSCQIDNPDDEELVLGLNDPVRYRHKTYEGCQAALAKPPRTPVRRKARARATLDQIESRPDTPWTRRRKG
jgi:hypothetical protein